MSRNTPIIIIDCLPGEGDELEARLMDVGANLTGTGEVWEYDFKHLTELISYAAGSALDYNAVQVVRGWTDAYTRAKSPLGDKPLIYEEAFILNRLALRFGATVCRPQDPREAGRDIWRLVTSAVRARQKVPTWMLNPDFANYAGAPDPLVVMVGDQHNHPADNEFDYPFHMNKASSQWLAHCMPSRQPDRIGYFNINDVGGDRVVTHLLEANVRGFIALGQEAAKGLRHLGVEPVSVVRHPSAARRFTANNPQAYTNELYLAINLALVAAART